MATQRLLHLIFLCCLIFYTTVISEVPYNIYVSSKNGNDNIGNGSINTPFATIQYTQKYVQSLIPTLSSHFIGNITIFIEGGNYYGPLSFSSMDSISSDNNNYIIYSSITNDPIPVSIEGGTIINSNWTQIKYLNNSSYSLYKTNLKNSNINNNHKIYQLFMNSQRMNLSHSVIYTYKYFNISTGIIITNTNMISHQTIINIINSDYIANNLMAVIYEQWTASIHPISSIIYDSKSGDINITLSTLPNNNISCCTNNKESGNRFYLINNYYLLQNNSFYYNFTTKDLYILLP
eukprot:434347_1